MEWLLKALGRLYSLVSRTPPAARGPRKDRQKEIEDEYFRKDRVVLGRPENNNSGSRRDVPSVSGRSEESDPYDDDGV